MITYQLVCVLMAVLVTGALVRCESEDSQVDTDKVDDVKPETEEEEDLQPAETGQLLNAIFGKFDSFKGKSFFSFPGKNGCYRDPCYPYGGGGGGGGGGVYYRYAQVPAPQPSYYYYYQQSAPAPPPPPPAPPVQPAPQPSYSPGVYYLIGIPISRPSYRIPPQPIPYRPAYVQPTIHCTASPCGNVPQYYGYGTGAASAGGQFVAGSSLSTVESQAPVGGGQEIVGAASVPVLKGFTPSEAFPEIEKPVEVSGAAAEVKC